MQSVNCQFEPGQRVHFSGESRRVGTVKYVGPVQGYDGAWVGMDWDSGEGKHDGSVNGVRYFRANSERSGSFVRSSSLSPGISLLEALYNRYRAESSQEENGMRALALPANFLRWWFLLIDHHGGELLLSLQMKCMSFRQATEGCQWSLSAKTRSRRSWVSWNI